MAEEHVQPMDRISVYLTRDEKRRLKKRLADLDISVSAWLRSMVLHFLALSDENEKKEEV